jgi:hypothetical protein
MADSVSSDHGVLVQRFTTIPVPQVVEPLAVVVEATERPVLNSFREKPAGGKLFGEVAATGIDKIGVVVPRVTLPDRASNIWRKQAEAFGFHIENP